MPDYCAICGKPLKGVRGANTCITCRMKKYQVEVQKEPEKREPEKPPTEPDNVKKKREKFFKRPAHPVQPVQPCRDFVAKPSEKEKAHELVEEPPVQEEPEEEPTEQLEIWLLTWNCATRLPQKAQLDPLIVTEASAGSADVIVVGVQEYPRKATIPEKIQLSLGDYKYIGRKVLEGRTGILTKNRQAVGVLIKRDLQGRTIFTASGNRYWGKGGVIQGVEITKNDTVFKVAFISAHLDSYGKREDDVRRIVNAFPKNQYDAVFMMGDLNYRLNPKGQTFTRASICERISSDPSGLLSGHDELLDSSLVQDGTYTFNFPDPAAHFLPTYKIKSYTEGNLLRTYFGEKGEEKPDKELKPKKKRTGIDIGWLDRIGWATKWDRVLSGKGTVAQQEFIGLHKVTMSDHAAVLMKVLVTVPK